LRNRASFSGILQVFWGIEKGLLKCFTCIQRSIYTLWSTYNQWSMKIRLPVTPWRLPSFFVILHSLFFTFWPLTKKPENWQNKYVEHFFQISMNNFGIFGVQSKY
jgi:hypothetical protein